MPQGEDGSNQLIGVCRKENDDAETLKKVNESWQIFNTSMIEVLIRKSESESISHDNSNSKRLILFVVHHFVVFV